MLNQEQLKALYAQLAAPLPQEAVERTSGLVTRKGYDTVGYRLAHLVHRLNQILGVGCLRVQPKFEVNELRGANGRDSYEAVCELVAQIGHWQDNQFVVIAEAPGIGSHVSMRRGDALKGSHTNALKRALSHFGPGWAAFAGAVDDDSVPPEGPASGPMPAPDAGSGRNGQTHTPAHSVVHQ